MFEKKYLMFVLTLMSIFITMCMVNETYAKYVSTANATTRSSIARWRILVNNDDITLGSTSTSLITPVFPGTSDIASGVIAPNAEGYFDLVLDGSNTDVSFTYTITIAPNSSSPVTELVATKYAINGATPVDFTGSGTPTLTGTVRLSDQSRVKNIRVYIKWDDSLNLMTNAEDTNTTTGNQKGMLDVTVNVIQAS